jgi:hypothetical protein
VPSAPHHLNRAATATTPYHQSLQAYANYECPRHPRPHHILPRAQLTRHLPRPASTKVAGRSNSKFACYEARSYEAYL